MKILNIRLSSLFKYCALCHDKCRSEFSLCLGCQKDLPHITSSCYQCGKILTKEYATNTVCGNCLSNHQPFSRTCALYAYQNPIDQMIIQLKFYGKLEYAKIFGYLIADKLKKHCYHNKRYPECIIPIPLHKTRLKSRGFNQAVEIAKPISKQLNIPLHLKHCQRIKSTLAQAQLNAKQRAQNIKNAFVMNGSFDYSYVAVIDDVITTGNTIREFCQFLQNSGVGHIDVWCAARTVE